MTNVRPYMMFKVDVASELQKAPFGWAGAAVHDLTAKHSELIHANWLACVTVGETCKAVHAAQMSKPVKRYALPTKAELACVGCRFS